MRNSGWNPQVCFRAASALAATTRALVESARELEEAPDDAGREAAEALRKAEAELARARRALQAAAATPPAPTP